MYFKTLYIEYEHNHVTILPFSARSSSINAGENWCKRLIDDVREWRNVATAFRNDCSRLAVLSPTHFPSPITPSL